jgi:acetaldehyde dehydrogenase
MVDEVQTYVPGYRLRGEPQFDRMDDGNGRVATFLEVEGAGDYLPPYSGNLDIMTAAATKVGEELARELLTIGARRTEGPTSPNSTGGPRP